MSAIDDILVDDTPPSKASLRDYLRPYTLVAQYNGVIPVSVDVMRFVFPVAVEFASGLPLSQAYADVAATSDTTFTIKKNGSSIGTIVFEAGSPPGIVWTFASTVSFAAGDRIEITSPDPADATLADITITLVGKR